jgi:YHS domain-containing protein
VIRLLIFIGLLYVVWRLMKRLMPAGGGNRRPIQRQGDAAVDEMVQDPVCGVYFPRSDGVRYREADKEIWFCSNKCKNEYINNNT